MAKYQVIVTDVGRQKMMDAAVNGQKVKITHIAVGDGGGGEVAPKESWTALTREVWRGEVSSYEIDPEREDGMRVYGIIPASSGGFTIREMGVFDEAGDLIAVSSTAAMQKPSVDSGMSMDMEIFQYILLATTENVEVIIDGNVVGATIQDVRNEIEKHNQDPEAHPELVQAMETTLEKHNQNPEAHKNLFEKVNQKVDEVVQEIVPEIGNVWDTQGKRKYRVPYWNTPYYTRTDLGGYKSSLFCVSEFYTIKNIVWGSRQWFDIEYRLYCQINESKQLRIYDFTTQSMKSTTSLNLNGATVEQAMIIGGDSKRKLLFIIAILLDGGIRKQHFIVYQYSSNGSVTLKLNQGYKTDTQIRGNPKVCIHNNQCMVLACYVYNMEYFIYQYDSNSITDQRTIALSNTAAFDIQRFHFDINEKNAYIATYIIDKTSEAFTGVVLYKVSIVDGSYQEIFRENHTYATGEGLYCYITDYGVIFHIGVKIYKFSLTSDQKTGNASNQLFSGNVFKINDQYLFSGVVVISASTLSTYKDLRKYSFLENLNNTGYVSNCLSACMMWENASETSIVDRLQYVACSLNDDEKDHFINIGDRWQQNSWDFWCSHNGTLGAAIVHVQLGHLTPFLLAQQS